MLKSVSLLMLSFVSVAYSAAQEGPALRPFTEQEKRDIEGAVLGAEPVRTFSAGERLRVLKITPVESEKDAEAAEILAEVVVVAYGTGRALRVVVDPRSNQVLRSQPMAGRPQSSPEEREEAETVIREDATLGALIRAGNRLQGGFVVDAPAERASGRFLEYHIADDQGQALLWEVVVDVAAREVVSRRQGERR